MPYHRVIASLMKIGFTQTAAGLIYTKGIMKHIEAKPCPFCGWPVIEAVFERKDGNTLYQIRCKSCKCGTGWFTYWGAAVDAWNRRPGDNNENAKGSMPGLSG